MKGLNVSPLCPPQRPVRLQPSGMVVSGVHGGHLRHLAGGGGGGGGGEGADLIETREMNRKSPYSCSVSRLDHNL